MNILLGMSGGLDSTFAAHILKSQGHSVTGAVLHMHCHTDVEGALRAGVNAGVPVRVIECGDEFVREVELPFAHEYIAGRTPNPCVVCNRAVKFGMLCRYAAAQGFDIVATGHYARIVRADGRCCVARSADDSKDQSYMLWRLSQDQLEMLYFPLGDTTKKDNRIRAREAGLPEAEARDSQEICFIPDGNRVGFIKDLLGEVPGEGDFIDCDGKVLGRHKGIINYTPGQRKGLGVSLGRQMYVTAVNAADNTVTLSERETYSAVVGISGLVFQLLPPGEYQIEAMVKLRYAQPPVAAAVTVIAMPGGEYRATAETAEPVRALTPGQSAVFYDREGRLLFGGFID